jgi:integrase
MGERKKITEAVVRRLRAPATGSTITWDTEARGLGVRITAEGVIAFLLLYRIHGRQRSITLGRYPELTLAEARKAAIAQRQKINQGIDPQEEKRALGKEPTFGELIDEYLKSGEFQKKRASTARDYRRMAEKILRPKLGRLRLKAVDRRDIEKLHAELSPDRQAGKYAANRCLALISVLFNYAMEAEWVIANPAVKVERYPEDECTSFLSREQIDRFFAALDAYPDQGSDREERSERQQGADVLRLLMYTGARLGEVLNADWSQFDFEHEMWTKSSHHVKQKQQTATELSEQAVELLAEMHATAGHPTRGLLFPGRDGRKARVTIHRPWMQVMKAAGLVEVRAVPGKRRHVVQRFKPMFRIHDLRHTFASHLIKEKVPLERVGRLLGHTQIQTTRRYVHLASEDQREAVNRLSKVLPFRKNRRAETICKPSVSAQPERQ